MRAAMIKIEVAMNLNLNLKQSRPKTVIARPMKEITEKASEESETIHVSERAISNNIL